MIVERNSCLKVADVQSDPEGVRSCRRSGDTGIGTGACGLIEKKLCILCLDKWSAVQLSTPAICSDISTILQWATKNYKQRSRCITVLSLAEPFHSAAISPLLSRHYWLSQWNSTLCRASNGPHTAQLRTMGSNSLDMMYTVDH